MEQRELGPRPAAGIPPLTSSAIGLGCMGLSQGYGPATGVQDAVRLIHAALDAGVTMLDTAMSYGAGHNEELVGRAIAGRPGQAVVATKFGIVRDGAGVRLDARPEHVAGWCDASLRRLGVDVIDLYYLHRVDPEVPLAATVAAMADLVTAGKVRYLGLSEVTAAQLGEAAVVHPITAVQFEWSLLWRQPEADLVPAARRHGTGLVTYSPLGRGLLTAALDRAAIDDSGFRRDDDRFHGPALHANLAQVDVLRAFAARYGCTPGQLALAWLLGQGPDVVPIPGTRNPERLAENAAAAALRLDPDGWRELDDALARGSWRGDRRSFAVPVTARDVRQERTVGAGEG